MKMSIIFMKDFAKKSRAALLWLALPSQFLRMAFFGEGLAECGHYWIDTGRANQSVPLARRTSGEETATW